MNTIGWAIVAIGLLFDIDLQKVMVGHEANESAKAIIGFIFFICLIMMAISTVRR